MAVAHIGVDELTPRQQQILALIQKGKVNKEVARELGIEEGTVKQHVVAIFKKLDVHSRTMAIQKWQAYQNALSSRQQLASDATVIDFRTQLERRPGGVAAFCLSDTLEKEDRRLVLSVLSEVGAHCQALFISRQTASCELVFGVNRVYPYQASLMVHALEVVYQRLQAIQPRVLDGVKAYVQTGMIIASIDRFGGWTEEVIASPVIALARQSSAELEWGCVQIASALLQALRIDGVLDFSPVEQVMPWQHLGTIQRLLPTVSVSHRVDDFFSQGQYLCLAEAGLGKTSCLSAYAQRHLLLGRSVHWVRFLPEVFEGSVVSCLHAQSWSWCDWLAQLPMCDDDVLLLDDVHMLPYSAQQQLMESLSRRRKDGLTLLTTACRLKFFSDFEQVMLPKWSDAALLNLIAQSCPAWDRSAPHAQSAWMHLAEGSLGILQMLCAMQIDLDDTRAFSWSLLAKVAADVDRYPMDRCLLKQLSLSDFPSDSAVVADLVSESEDYLQSALDYLVDLHWLSRGDQFGFQIRQPLVKWVIRQLMVHHLTLDAFSARG